MKKWLLLALLVVLSFSLSACNPLESKMKAGLQVLTDDVATSLFLNGEYLDKTPFINKDIKPGVYQLKIQPDDPNLAPFDTTINLRPGLLTVVTWKPGTRSEYGGGIIYELEKIQEKKKGEASFVTIPDNAIIQFDDREKEFSPLIINDLEPGHHEFSISLPSFVTQKHTVNVVAGHRLNIYAKLAKSPNGDKKTTENIEPTSIIVPESSSSSTHNSSSSAIQRTAITGKKVLITSTGFFVDGQESLRVRDKASSSGRELGFALVGQEYKYLDAANNWFKIEFEEKEGWISGKYAKLITE